MKILIGVDSSPHSEATIAEVANRPWPNGSIHASVVSDGGANARGNGDTPH